MIIAGAGGAAHLAGVIAAHTTLPVIGVPIPSTSLQGMDSLLATVQMPAGIPVATVAIGKPGATNAGILAAQMIALSDDSIAKKLVAYQRRSWRAAGGGEIEKVEGFAGGLISLCCHSEEQSDEESQVAARTKKKNRDPSLCSGMDNTSLGLKML